MKRGIIVIHDLTYSGAPLFSLYVARILKKNGIAVEIISFYEGKLRIEFERNDIPVDIYDEKKYRDRSLLEKKIKQTDFLIAFTILTYEVVERFRFCTPIIWYIHEGKNLNGYLINYHMREVFLRFDKIWCVSEYVNEYLYTKYKKKSQILHNFVPDEKCLLECKRSEKKGKSFLLIGTIEKRKGYEEFLAAYLKLDDYYKEQSEIHAAGHYREDEYCSNVLKIFEQEKRLFYHGILTNRKDIMELYQNSDVVVVPSQDESCSLVVLEAMMMGKPVIVSQNVGAKYMVNEKNGWIVETGNVQQLSDLMGEIINNKYDLEEMGKAARQSYVLYATQEQYENMLLKLVKREIRIPSFIWKPLHYPLHLVWKEYCKYNITPFKNVQIPKGSRIILYGAGKNGQQWWEKLQTRRYCNVIAWLDKNETGIPNVVQLEKMKKKKFDYVVITVLNKKTQEEIKRELILEGIKEHQLIFLNE